MPKAKSAWTALQPFRFRDGERMVAVDRGATVPAAVLADDALRLRLLRTKMIYDPEHPESYGAQQAPPSRMAKLQVDAAKPLAPVEQDQEVSPDVIAERRAAGFERMRQLNYRLNNPTPWTPTKQPEPGMPTGSYPPARLGG